ncbi:hypothetical protein CN285_29670 [Bacillus cereus]|nr:hypothetical protein CN285_29670 [Bacillus cereus]PGM50950.1 hypothetical protein CN947_27790 [Bacillus cereus]
MKLYSVSIDYSLTPIQEWNNINCIFTYSHKPLSFHMINPLQIHAECNIIAKLGIFFFSI